MTETAPAYGLWFLVIVNSAIFILFAYSFFKPKTKRDWRTFGAFSAFLVALFTEMYGFPLTIYFLSGWLQSPIRASTGYRTTPGTCSRCCSGGRPTRISRRSISSASLSSVAASS